MNDSNPAKPDWMIAAEGLLYFIIGAVPPILPILDSDKVLDARLVTVMVFSGLAGGAVTLKAFFSQAFASK